MASPEGKARTGVGNGLNSNYHKIMLGFGVFGGSIARLVLQGDTPGMAFIRQR